MENIDVEIKILDYLQGHLSETERREVEKLRKSSPAFDVQFNEVQQAWVGLDIRMVPGVNPEMKTNFNAMLKTFELEQEHKKASIWNVFADLFKYKPQYNWAYAVLLVCFGTAMAYMFLQQQNNSGQLNDNRQAILLTMLDNPAATERIKAIGYTEDLHTVNDKVINALLITLNTDDNENVRLVTLDMLVKLANNPKVREGLVNSIIKQDSELMKAALADAMLLLQEKRSTKSFKKLLEDQHKESPLIKRKIEQTVKELETI